LATGGVSRAACQARLRDARVVVIGLGGLGAWALWRSRPRGSDGSSAWTATSSSAATQPPDALSRGDVGRPKALATARTIAAFNSDISFEAIARRLDGPDAVAAVVAGADFVVEAADWPPYRLSRWINACCADAACPRGRQPVPAADSRGPTFVPGVRGCLGCLEESARRATRCSTSWPPGRQQADTFAATFAPACSLIGGVLSSDGDPPHHGPGRAATLGASLVIDIRTLEQHRLTVEPVPGCAICSG